MRLKFFLNHAHAVEGLIGIGIYTNKILTRLDLFYALNRTNFALEYRPFSFSFFFYPQSPAVIFKMVNIRPENVPGRAF